MGMDVCLHLQAPPLPLVLQSHRTLGKAVSWVRALALTPAGLEFKSLYGTLIRLLTFPSLFPHLKRITKIYISGFL